MFAVEYNYCYYYLKWTLSSSNFHNNPSALTTHNELRWIAATKYLLKCTQCTLTPKPFQVKFSEIKVFTMKLWLMRCCHRNEWYVWQCYSDYHIAIATAAATAIATVLVWLIVVAFFSSGVLRWRNIMCASGAAQCGNVMLLAMMMAKNGKRKQK